MDGLAGFADLRDMASGSSSGAGDMASADVATAKAKATLIINLIIVSSDKRPSTPPMLGDGRAEPNQPGQGGGPNPVAGYGHPTIQTISGPAPPPDMGSTGLKP